MNSHLFTFTNYKTERNSNFFNLYNKVDKTYLNLMGKNKLSTKFYTNSVYPLFFLILTPLLLIKLIKNKNVKNYVVLFPGGLEIIFLKIFQPLFSYKITYDTFTSFHLTLVDDRKLIKENSIFAKIIKFLDKIFFTLPDKLIFETNEMKNYLEEFLNKKKLLITQETEIIRKRIGDLFMYGDIDFLIDLFDFKRWYELADNGLDSFGKIFDEKLNSSNKFEWFELLKKYCEFENIYNLKWIDLRVSWHEDLKFKTNKLLKNDLQNYSEC